MSSEINPDNYDGCQVIDIRRGKGARANTVYAKLVNKDGELLISATLDHIMSALKQRV